MGDQQLRCFTSYSRANSDFVDRLEADLISRDIYTWVDRRKLEGGDFWLQKLQDAIDQTQVFLLCISPEAMDSKYVLAEYQYAMQENKTIIPLVIRQTKVWLGLHSINWINFEGFPNHYEQNLSNLLVALSRIEIQTISKRAASSVSLEDIPAEIPELIELPSKPAEVNADLNELFRLGVSAKARGDLDRAAILWRKVVERDANFQEGFAAKQLQELEKQLHPIRVERLRSRANTAHMAGQWGEEIGAWQALLGLEANDNQARERIPVAQHNQKHAWLYENAIALVRQNDLTGAKEQLAMLWQAAPYYVDYQELAGIVQHTSPQTFAIARLKEQRQIEQSKRIENRKELISDYWYYLRADTGLDTSIRKNCGYWLHILAIFFFVVYATYALILLASDQVFAALASLCASLIIPTAGYYILKTSGFIIDRWN